MDRNKILQIIQRDLNELTELTDEMAGKERISDLEIEFALGKSRIISQEFDYLKELNQQTIPGYGIEKEMKDNDLADPGPDFREDEEQAGPGKKVVEFDDFEDAPLAQEQPVIPDGPGNNLTETDQPEPEVLQLESEDQAVAESEPIEAESPEPASVNPEFSEAETFRSEIAEAGSGPETPDRETPGPIIREQEEEEEMITHEDDSETGSSKKTVAEIFVHEKSLNDTLLTGRTIDHKLAATPLTRLESAIGLNDRFLFIRELFKSDAGLFNKTIKQIDQMDNLNEAVIFLNKHFKWKKNEASLKFAQLIKRRFSN